MTTSMKPLPPIEQYNIYSNQYSVAQQSLPVKNSASSSKNLKNSSSQEKLLRDRIMQSGFAKQPKRERDAMVAQIFASKKSLNADLATATTSGFNKKK